MLLGAYTDKYYQGYYYFKAQNLRRRLRAAYDKALCDLRSAVDANDADDGLRDSAGRRPAEVLMQHSWEQITNTCPFNITHHPAISIPCGSEKAAARSV